jgi:hypothetical protein
MAQRKAVARTSRESFLAIRSHRHWKAWIEDRRLYTLGGGKSGNGASQNRQAAGQLSSRFGHGCKEQKLPMPGPSVAADCGGADIR